MNRLDRLGSITVVDNNIVLKVIDYMSWYNHSTISEAWDTKQ